MSTLRYFMWQWQHVFQGSAAHLAQRFLKPLDPHLASDSIFALTVRGMRQEERVRAWRRSKIGIARPDHPNGRRTRSWISLSLRCNLC
jgi:hypothetical protein